MKATKLKTYFEYWKVKGIYGEECIKRMLKRKDLRYHKKSFNGNGSCKHEFNDWHSCPYQEDINGNNDDHYCRCCRDCMHECAMDI